MTESSINHNHKYVFVPEENTIPDKLNGILSTGIKPDETYHLRNPANTAFVVVVYQWNQNVVVNFHLIFLIC